ncbi:MAG: NAD-dependent epimerase/dehydratase family protein [Bacteroidetes bacterium]|nr:NAD-dependent epimerase/dehydratase family protein [Bacteroidota bacterium]
MNALKNITLVTGASGFVGRHLVKYLSEKGKLVKALYNNTIPDESLLQLKGIIWQKCDLLDVYDVESVMQDVDEIYHCAAMVSFRREDRLQMMHFNLESTTNIVNAALDAGIRKLLYMSSIATLGRNGEGKEISEETQWEESVHNSMYSQSKYNAELEVWRGMAEGLNAVIVNPGIILGEGDWDKGSSRLMKVVYKEFPFYTSGINAWVDVKDVVDISYRLMESGIADERFILSSGNYAYKDIFSRMAAALNRKPPYIRANKWMTSLVWRISVLKNKLLGGDITITKETARTSQSKNYYNNQKLIKYLPEFQYTPLDSTIKRMAVAYIAENRLKNQ